MDRQEQRRQMVQRQIEARGVRQPAVLEAMRAVPREAFLPMHLSELTYEDTPLPIEEGQTISQPYIVAAMAEALRIGPNDRVLEIGTGSGYVAAVLGEIAAAVYTIERHRVLADEAKRRLHGLGYRNVHVLCGDGTLGWPEHAPFDAILVSAGGPSVPKALVEQLAPGGRMVIPVGAEVRNQSLLRVTKQPDGETRTEDLGGVREGPVVQVLRDLLERRVEYALADGDRFFDATSNVHLVAAAEEYYRVMYYGGSDSWNLRDQHMFDILERLLEFRGLRAEAIVWAHNSHIGDARAKEMGAARGEHNIGQLCRMSFRDSAFCIGFGTHTGTVAAATDWGGPMEVKRVRPSHPTSYERLFHDAEVPAFLLALRNPVREAVREELAPPRLERAIGVIYRPETELQSHYFQAALPWQFDAYVWFDETHAVRALDAESARQEIPQVYG